MFGESEEELRLIAQWSGEASKEWWTKLDDAQRAEIEKMEPSRLFILGWMCCKAKQITTVSS